MLYCVCVCADELASAVASSDCRRSDHHHRLCSCRSCSWRDDVTNTTTNINTTNTNTDINTDTDTNTPHDMTSSWPCCFALHTNSTMSGRRLRQAVKQVRSTTRRRTSAPLHTCNTSCDDTARVCVSVCLCVRSSSRRGRSGTRRWWSLAWVTCTLTTSPPMKSTRYTAAEAHGYCST